jgi:hypothetical protein
MSGNRGEKSQKLTASQVSHLVKQIWCLKFKLSTQKNNYLKILVIYYCINYNPAIVEKKRIFFLAPGGCL